MEIITLRMAELTPYEKNAKKHPAKQVEQIKESIERFGMNDPIGVWGDRNIIVEGHGRYLACKELGIEEVPCVRLDHLTDVERKEYTLIHNKTTMNSDFDIDVLNDELSDIMVDDQDIDMKFYDFDVPTESDYEITEDDVPEVSDVPHRAKLGDIWKLGDHRLMCGDSTDKKSVSLLMGNENADMVFTDPPYNIDYKGVKDDRKIKNDKMTDDDFVEFLKASIMKSDTAYVCCSWQYAHLFKKAMEEIGMPPKAMIVWNKVNPAQNLDKYFKQHELIWYFGKFGGQKTLRGDIWECKRQKNTLHPTMKPIELIAMALEDQPDKKIVYDGFGGSGSTLIACEQIGRKCYTMELDPQYADVIIARWERLTGGKAELING